MESLRDEVERFFADYSTRFNLALVDNPISDIDGAASAMADSLIESSPLGIRCGKNNAGLRAIISKGYAFYQIHTVNGHRVDRAYRTGI